MLGHNLVFADGGAAPTKRGLCSNIGKGSRNGWKGHLQLRGRHRGPGSGRPGGLPGHRGAVLGDDHDPVSWGDGWPLGRRVQGEDGGPGGRQPGGVMSQSARHHDY